MDKLDWDQVGPHRGRRVRDGHDQRPGGSVDATVSRFQARSGSTASSLSIPSRSPGRFSWEFTRSPSGQFRRFVEKSGYQTEAEKDGKGSYVWDETKKAWELDPSKNWRNPGFPQTDDHPVVCVSHNDAMAFCQWLSQKEGRTYRLPTEAEWEFACRADTTTLYSNGDDPEGLVSIANVADATFKRKFPDFACIKGDDGYPYTASVGSFAPNRWGLYDMIGNVWEWCADWYDEKYYASSPADGSAWRTQGLAPGHPGR